MADPKQLKFQFVVDEASLQKTRQLIRELTADLSKLNEMAGKAGFGGAGGGGGGVNVSGSGNKSPEQQRVIAKVAPAGRAIAQNFLDQKQVFKGIADGSKDSMKTMTDALKRAVQEQRQEVGKLKQSLDALEGTYNRLGGAASGAVGKKIQAKAVQLSGRIHRGQAQLGELEGMMPRGPELMPEVPWPGQEGGKASLWSRFKGAMTQSRSLPGLGGMLGQGSSMGALAGRFGISPGMIGGAGLATVGAWGLKNIANQVWDGPNQTLRSDAAMGSTFGQRSLDIRGGEFRNLAATQSILRDQNKRSDYNDLNSGWRRFVHSGKAFISGDFNEALSGRAADIAVTQKQQEQQQMERESNPLQDQIMGEFQNYNSSLATARAFHVGAPKGGGSVLQNIYKIRQSLPGFSDGEIAGSLGTLSSQGTRKGAWGMVGAGLHGEAAGIHGLSGSMGVMSRFGGGLNFGNTLRSMAGGNMDATTAGIAGQFIAGQQAQLGMNLGARGGDFQGSGLLDMISAGTQGQGGRAVMDQNIRGADYLSRSTRGETNPYQTARNLMIAQQAAPGMNMYGTSMLARGMSLTELADAAQGKGGDANAVFKALGGNKDMASKYFKGQTKSLLEGVSAQGLGDTAAGKMATAMAGSDMDPREFFKKKKWKEAGFKTEQEALEGYAGALAASDEELGKDPAKAMGLARDISGAGGAIKKGGKVGAPGGGAQEMELAKEHLKALTAQVQSAASAMSELTASTKSLALRARLEGEGIDMKTGDAAMRERRERVLMNLPANATKQQYNDSMQEFELMDRVSGMKKDTDRINALTGAGIKDPTGWMRKHKVGGWK